MKLSYTGNHILVCSPLVCILHSCPVCLYQLFIFRVSFLQRIIATSSRDKRIINQTCTVYNCSERQLFLWSFLTFVHNIEWPWIYQNEGWYGYHLSNNRLMSLSLFFLPQNKSQQFSITEQQEKSRVKTKLLHLSTTSTQTSFIFYLVRR